MNIEYEATFTKINKNKMHQKLKNLGARLIKPEFLMKRVVFIPPKKIKNGWMRVRDEGDKITMSLKIVHGKKITAQKEIELIIDDFENGCNFLESIGAKRKSYQETKRELWHLNDVEITLDTWPGLKPVIEIEGKNEQDVKAVAEKLDFDWSKAIFDSIDYVYEQELGIPREVINNQTPEATFKNPPKPYKK
ncbi:MAG: CYTH domain-containing protein [Candidatus Parcubacteria bacterium]|nr:CYTH domain-containing protein [Candidatus Parcubacteria bacterium]